MRVPARCMSLPHACSDPSNHAVVNILKQHTTNSDLKRYCIAMMDKLGSFAYTVPAYGPSPC